jgi:hypothetical protein
LLIYRRRLEEAQIFCLILFTLFKEPSLNTTYYNMERIIFQGRMGLRERVDNSNRNRYSVILY